MCATNSLSTEEIVHKTKSSLEILESLKNDYHRKLHLMKENNESLFNTVCDTRTINCESSLKQIEFGISECEIILQLYEFLQISDSERTKSELQIAALDTENKSLKDELIMIQKRLEHSERYVCQLEEVNKHLKFMNELKVLDTSEEEMEQQFTDDTQCSLSQRNKKYSSSDSLNTKNPKTKFRETIISLLLRADKKVLNNKQETSETFASTKDTLSMWKSRSQSSVINMVEKESKISFYQAFDVPRRLYREYQMKDLVNLESFITEVWKYKCPLIRYQLSNIFFNYHFIVFKTKDLFWSVETTKEGIDIQIAKLMEDVLERTCLGKERYKNVTQLESHKGKIRVIDLIYFINTTRIWGNHKFCSEIIQKIKDG